MARKTIPEDAILMKGTLDGLKIVLDDTHKFLPVFELLEKKIKISKAFFAGNKISLALKTRVMTRDEFDYARTHLLFKYGIDIQSDVPVDQLQKSEPTLTTPPVTSVTTPVQSNIKIVGHTLRAGQMVEYGGDIVILGDVNPGAEVTSTGSIYIFGALRGRIWCGSKGDRNASIVALDFEPVQMRIADKVVVSPGRTPNKEQVPQKAFIDGDSIVVVRVR
jgi:septum site-determining protein MinC